MNKSYDVLRGKKVKVHKFRIDQHDYSTTLNLWVRRSKCQESSTRIIERTYGRQGGTASTADRIAGNKYETIIQRNVEKEVRRIYGL